MHLLEAYAAVSGALIDKCFIHEEKIELPSKPYITLHSYNPKGSSRQYKYWNQVIEKLRKNPRFIYDIVQVGGSSDIPAPVNVSYLGKTDYNSLAYLIKHSELHLGFDSLPVHIASHYDKKMVVLYAHYINNTKPYFSSIENIVLLGPDHSKVKPVFSHEDPFDQINTINFNTIVESVERLLDI